MTLTVLHQIDQSTAQPAHDFVSSLRTVTVPKGSAGKPSPTQGTNLPNGVIVHFNVQEFRF